MFGAIRLLLRVSIGGIIAGGPHGAEGGINQGPGGSNGGGIGLDAIGRNGASGRAADKVEGNTYDEDGGSAYADAGNPYNGTPGGSAGASAIASFW